jgi:hypothetical protein
MIGGFVVDIGPILLGSTEEVLIGLERRLSASLGVSDLGNSHTAWEPTIVDELLRTSRSLASSSQTESVSHINVVSSSDPVPALKIERELIEETGLEGSPRVGSEDSRYLVEGAREFTLGAG